jgi:hypothetical protein
MNHLERLYNLSLRYVFEPGLNWVIDHPIVSVAVVAALIYFSVRNYRML